MAIIYLRNRMEPRMRVSHDEVTGTFLVVPETSDEIRWLREAAQGDRHVTIAKAAFATPDPGPRNDLVPEGGTRNAAGSV